MTSDLPTSGDINVDNLLGPAKWGDAVGTGVVVTYSFPTSGAVWKDNYGLNEPATFQPLTDAQQAAAHEALELWSDLANISFVEVDETASDVGTIRFGRSDAPSTAWGNYPSDDPSGGDIWLGPYFSTGSTYPEGSYNFFAFLHEIGHAIGLKHPHDALALNNAVLPPSDDWLGNSVMSYRSYIGDSVEGGVSNWFFPTTPMLNDVEAVQYVYGANLETRSGDTTYAWAPGQRLFETIYDAGGVDTIDWSNQTTPADITLKPGLWSELGPAYTWSGGSVPTTLAIARDTWIENAIGGSGDDRLDGNALANELRGGYGNDLVEGGAGDDLLSGGYGIDVLKGGKGDDILQGGRGHDLLDGGDGADVLKGGRGWDTFRWYRASDSPLDGPDTVEKFRPGQGDVLDFSRMEERPAGGFIWLGTDHYADDATGQVRYKALEGAVLLKVSTDAEPGPEMVVLVKGVTGLSDLDLLL